MRFGNFRKIGESQIVLKKKKGNNIMGTMKVVLSLVLALSASTAFAAEFGNYPVKKILTKVSPCVQESQTKVRLYLTYAVSGMEMTYSSTWDGWITQVSDLKKNVNLDDKTSSLGFTRKEVCEQFRNAILSVSRNQ